jgi:YrbI family 3-deoxy-D-manno-octulosonate 8-phosphate phosphatase
MRNLKRFNSLDGHGIKMLKDNGVEVAVITARDSKAVAYRMKNLGITHFYQGQADKVVAFNDLLQKLNLSADSVAYVGDDVIDLPVMTKIAATSTPLSLSILIPCPSSELKRFNSVPSSVKYSPPSVSTPSTSKITS